MLVMRADLAVRATEWAALDRKANPLRVPLPLVAIFSRTWGLVRADVNKAGMVRETPLFWACARGMEDVVRILVDGGADVSRAWRGRRKPLSLAMATERYRDDISRVLRQGTTAKADDWEDQELASILRSFEFWLDENQA